MTGTPSHLIQLPGRINYQAAAGQSFLFFGVESAGLSAGLPAAFSVFVAVLSVFVSTLLAVVLSLEDPEPLEDLLL